MKALIIFGAEYLYLVAVAIATTYVLVQPREKQKQILIFAFIALPTIYIISKIGGFSKTLFVSG